MIIAASYTISFQIGLATTIAVIFHEMPQELGDYGILLYAGFDKSKALILNFFSSASVVFGGVFTMIFFKSLDVLGGALVAFSAGAFIYLSASELIPELQEEKNFLRSLIQFAIFILGMVLIWSLGLIFAE